MRLFQPRQGDGNPNDPYMINPKGFKVQVPEARVRDLLGQGFVLVDRKWQPTRKVQEPEDDLFREEPLPIQELHKKSVEILEVTEL